MSRESQLKTTTQYLRELMRRRDWLNKKIERETNESAKVYEASERDALEWIVCEYLRVAIPKALAEGKADLVDRWLVAVPYAEIEEKIRTRTTIKNKRGEHRRQQVALENLGLLASDTGEEEV